MSIQIPALANEYGFMKEPVGAHSSRTMMLAELRLLLAACPQSEAALERLFPKFKGVDHPSWNTVINRATQGAADALSVVGYNGDVDKYPACQEVRTFIGSSGKKGSEVRKHFMGAGYGWPQEAVDGVLLCVYGTTDLFVGITPISFSIER
jgi:hypothetical protein